MPGTNSSGRTVGRSRRHVALILLLPLLASCNEYRERSDHVSMQLGNAVAVNKAVHVSNPWPAGAARANLPYDAERMSSGYHAYRSIALSRSDPAGSEATGNAAIAPAPDSGAGASAGSASH